MLSHQQIHDANPIALAAVDATLPNLPIVYANPAFVRMSRVGIETLLGQNYWDVLGVDASQTGVQTLQRMISYGGTGQVMVVLNPACSGAVSHRVHASPILAPAPSNDIYLPLPAYCTGPTVGSYVMAHIDVSDAQRYQAALEQEATHDALTGLANLMLLRRRIREAIVDAAVHSQKIWVIFLDLDRFKSINDSLGHRAGDRLLQILANRLSNFVLPGDTVARLGGDEFVMVMRDSEYHQMDVASIEQLIKSIAQPVPVDGHELVVTCSIGIALFPLHGADPEKLVECADVAMYSAKQQGRNTFKFYETAFNERALARLVMESSLRTAIERDEFSLHYQPQVDLKSGCISGMEALIYWRHPTRGNVAPDEFIALAEETGLIVLIGEWVLREACRQNKAWQDAGLGFLRVAVNLSPRQFSHPDLVASIDRILCETGLAPCYLEIELTENLIMTEIGRAVEILKDLKTHGIQLSIDDFGTGYSSLSYLKKFPIDVLKIDRTFVKDIGTDPDDEAIVKSIIALAHSLKLHVIAEGVETPEQLAFLAQHGCDEFQGFYFSRPLSPAVFGRMLLEQTPRSSPIGEPG
ncbi:MAG: EAL domain-containing protein [Pseudomonadota bacterium]